jgi:hypothetical protein
MLIPASRLAVTFSELSHLLRSILITKTSTLLLDDPPPSYASVLSSLLTAVNRLESTVRYLGIEVDDALEMAEQTEV